MKTPTRNLVVITGLSLPLLNVRVLNFAPLRKGRDPEIDVVTGRSTLLRPWNASILAEELDLAETDLTISHIEQLSSACSFRPKSFRHKDSPDILEKIKQRKLLQGREGRDLGKEIAKLRKEANTSWLISVMDKASKGDFHAISYFKRRQSVLTTHSNYIIPA